LFLSGIEISMALSFLSLSLLLLRGVKL
jgi:hypothetical protein